MKELMQKCTYAVLTPSTICYEYLTIGGIVFLIQIAENQQKIKQYFLKEKLAFELESLTNGKENEFPYSLTQQIKIFDRLSPERLTNIFYSLQA